MAIEDLSRGIRKCADACIKALDKYSGDARIPNEPNDRTSLRFDKEYWFRILVISNHPTLHFKDLSARRNVAFAKLSESLTAVF